MKRALLCVLLAVLLLCGCTRAPDAGEPLTLCLGAEPATLDPARTENGVGATYVVNLFSGLTGYRAGGDGGRELTPELCEQLPVPESLPDGRVQYVFTLRGGLKWSDGAPLTAADFVYAWNRACTLEDAAAPYLFACIDGYGSGRLNVTASPDGRTLTVVLAEAMPTFLQLCAQPAYAPVPSGAAEETSWTADGAGFAASGPYTVSAWTDEGLTYVKNPAYWDADNVVAETVRFAFDPDPDAASSAFLARAYALVWPVPDAALDDLRANHAPELHTVSRLATYSLCFAVNDPALSAFTQPERAQIRTAQKMLLPENKRVLPRLHAANRNLSALLTWSMENAVQTADSMKARGYGVRRRTTFHLFVFDSRDAAVLGLILALAGICVLGRVFGHGTMEFYPRMDAVFTGISGTVLYIAFAVLALFPSILEMKEKLTWRCCGLTD